MTSSFNANIYNNLGEHHISYWHYQEFTYRNFQQSNRTTPILGLHWF